MTVRVLSVNGLSYKNIIRDVSFNWKQGEVIALMGANGSGKSTLARLITGLIEPDAGKVELIHRASGLAIDAECDLEPLPWPAEGRWREIAFIGQHPRRQTIGASVAEELGFGLLNLGMPVKDVQLRVKELAAAIGLEGKVNQSPSTLSGGERQRLVTAAILAMKPAFVILDEALTMLDLRAQDRILELLWQNRSSNDQNNELMGQLWITHDPELALRADRLLLMKDGSLWDAGSPAEALASSEIREEYGIRADQGIHGRGSDDTRVEKGTQDHGRERVLEWVDCRYGERLSIDNKIHRGEFIGIIGPSGAGKTTLLESVIGLNLASAGVFKAFGEALDKRNLLSLRQRCRLVLQEPGEYFIGHNVYDEVFYGRSRREAKTKNDESLKYLARFGITAEMTVKPPEHLSGGEKQRVALAAAFQSEPEVLLLDEPMLGLDGPGREQILSFITEMRRQITILYVTHDLAEVRELADRLWLIEDGRLTLDIPASSWQDYRDCIQAAGVRCPAYGGERSEGI